jgi:hypothetical protein
MRIYLVLSLIFVSVHSIGCLAMGRYTKLISQPYCQRIEAESLDPGDITRAYGKGAPYPLQDPDASSYLALYGWGKGVSIRWRFPVFSHGDYKIALRYSSQSDVSLIIKIDGSPIHPDMRGLRLPATGARKNYRICTIGSGDGDIVVRLSPGLHRISLELVEGEGFILDFIDIIGIEGGSAGVSRKLQIELLYPRGGEKVSGISMVKWAIGPWDGDKPLVTVWLEGLDGRWKREIASEVADVEFVEWNTELVPNGSYTLRISARAGMSEAEDVTSLPIEVLNAPPKISRDESLALAKMGRWVYTGSNLERVREAAIYGFDVVEIDIGEVEWKTKMIWRDDKGEWHFDRVDQVVDLASRLGMKAFIRIHAPDFAPLKFQPSRKRDGTIMAVPSIYDPSYRLYLLSFFRDVVKRYRDVGAVLGFRPCWGYGGKYWAHFDSYWDDYAKDDFIRYCKMKGYEVDGFPEDIPTHNNISKLHALFWEWRYDSFASFTKSLISVIAENKAPWQLIAAWSYIPVPVGDISSALIGHEGSYYLDDPNVDIVSCSAGMNMWRKNAYTGGKIFMAEAGPYDITGQAWEFSMGGAERSLLKGELRKIVAGIIPEAIYVEGTERHAFHQQMDRVAKIMKDFLPGAIEEQRAPVLLVSGVPYGMIYGRYNLYEEEFVVTSFLNRSVPFDLTSERTVEVHPEILDLYKVVVIPNSMGLRDGMIRAIIGTKAKVLLVGDSGSVKFGEPFSKGIQPLIPEDGKRIFRRIITGDMETFVDFVRRCGVRVPEIKGGVLFRNPRAIYLANVVGRERESYRYEIELSEGGDIFRPFVFDPSGGLKKNTPYIIWAKEGGTSATIFLEPGDTCLLLRLPISVKPRGATWQISLGKVGVDGVRMRIRGRGKGIVEAGRRSVDVDLGKKGMLNLLYMLGIYETEVRIPFEKGEWMGIGERVPEPRLSLSKVKPKRGTYAMLSAKILREWGGMPLSGTVLITPEGWERSEIRKDEGSISFLIKIPPRAEPGSYSIGLKAIYGSFLSSSSSLDFEVRAQ